MKKKIFAVLAAAFVLGMSICACNGEKPEVNTSEEVSAQAVLPADSQTDPSGENTNPTPAESYETILGKIEFPEMYSKVLLHLLPHHGLTPL